MATKVLTPKEQIEQQKAYASAQPSSVGLADDNLFVLGMKDVFYRNEGNALGDIIDNSVESGATFCHVAYNTNDAGKILEIAVIDNGCGIDSSFLPHALRWGGSSRHNSRNLFGRYGFGLPTASIKHGDAYSVYSRTDRNDQFSVVSVDLDDMKGGNRLELPSVKTSELPEWVSAYISEHVGEEKDVATVILLSKRNSLVWPNKTTSVGKLMRHFGITYGSILNGQCKVYVDGDRVEQIDPLFITPSARHFDIDGTRATDHSVPPIKFRDRNGNWHDVTVRMSYMDVAAVDAKERNSGNRLTKPRASLKTDYNGIFVYRNGRFIEVYKPGYIGLNLSGSYSRQIGLSVDFPAELDEYFGITPQKQTISISEPLDKLLEAAIMPAYRSFYKMIEEERALLKQQKRLIKMPSGVEVRASELAFAKIDARRPARPKSVKAAEEANAALIKKAKEIATTTGRTIEEEKLALEKTLIAHPYKIEADHGRPNTPFFEPDQVGPQTVIYLNTNHKFYTEVYGRLKESEVGIRSGIEALLVALARAELSKGGEDRVFYMQERAAWSSDLSQALEIIPMLLTDEDTYEAAMAMDPDRNFLEKEAEEESE
jgi:Histidine kinase-, DNA gyrase B-, and HSP90-like ATPase